MPSKVVPPLPLSNFWRKQPCAWSIVDRNEEESTVVELKSIVGDCASKNYRFGNEFFFTNEQKSYSIFHPCRRKSHHPPEHVII